MNAQIKLHEDLIELLKTIRFAERRIKTHEENIKGLHGWFPELQSKYSNQRTTTINARARLITRYNRKVINLPIL